MIGKWMLIFGVVLVVVGALVWLVESLGLVLVSISFGSSFFLASFSGFSFFAWALALKMA